MGTDTEKLLAGLAVPFVVRPGRGVKVPLARLDTIHKIMSPVIGGRVAIIEHTLAPGCLAAPLHRHSREDKLSFVLAGEMGTLLGEHVARVCQGSYVLKPKGQWHTFWNAGTRELRIMELIVPGGFEKHFAQLSTQLDYGVVDTTVIERAAAEYGVEYSFDTVPAICKRFAVTLDAWPTVHIVTMS